MRILNPNSPDVRGGKEVKITYDTDAKAMYIYLKKERGKHLKTVQVHGYESLNLDYNTAHELVGLEILNVNEQPTLEVFPEP